MFRFGVPVLDLAAERQEKLLEKAGYKIARTRIFLLCRTRSSIWSAGTMGGVRSAWPPKKRSDSGARALAC